MDITKLRKELMLAPMKSNFTFTRDEVLELLAAQSTPAQGEHVLVPRTLLEWAQQNIDCVEDDDERERVSAALDAAMK